VQLPPPGGSLFTLQAALA